MSADVVTERNLYEAALRYLQRHASSADNLKNVLGRRVKRWEIRTKQIQPPEAPFWIELAVVKCQSLGYINDMHYAEQKIASLRRQGRSRLYVARAMQAKGVAKEIVKQFLDAGEDSELAAALRHVERRRLGASRDAETRQKDLAKLLRAGFSMTIAKKALDALPSG